MHTRHAHAVHMLHARLPAAGSASICAATASGPPVRMVSMVMAWTSAALVANPSPRPTLFSSMYSARREAPKPKARSRANSVSATGVRVPEPSAART